MLPEKATKLSQFHGPRTPSFLSYHSLSSKDTDFFPRVCFLGQPCPLPPLPSLGKAVYEGMFPGSHVPGKACSGKAC